jgi:phytoene dehydrogenase-like protein
MDDHADRENTPDDDDINLDGFFAQADEVAKRSPEEQEAWLRQLAELAQGLPELDQTLQKLRDYLKVSRSDAQAQDALFRSEVRLTHSTEQLETELRPWLEGLFDGSRPLPQDPQARTNWMLYLTIMGHMLPSLRERFAQADGQAYLMQFLRENGPMDCPP